MDKEELEKLFGDNKLTYISFKAASLVNIMNFVSVLLQIDDETLDYYYEIDVNELLESDLPKEEYNVMKDQGWSFNKDRDKLIINLTI